MTSSTAELAWIRSYSRGQQGLELPEALALEELPPRARADTQAAWTRWHDQSCARFFEPGQWRFYEILEQARVDTLASSELPGVASNLSLSAQLPEQADPSALILYRLARKCFKAGLDVDLDAEKTLIRGRRSIWRRLTRRLGNSEPDQAMVERIDLNWLLPRLVASRDHLGSTVNFARLMVPVCRQLAGAALTAQDDEAPNDLDSSTADALGSEDPKNESIEGFGGDRAVPEISRRFPDYRLYTTDFDEIGPAQRWYQASDNVALQQLDCMDRREAKRLAHRLQRQLQRLRLRRWSFDQDEGLLDSRRLARLVGDHPDHRVFRVESQSRVPEAAITFLVDQSGSMRGEAHQIAAQALDLAVHTLEVCGLSTEVLGYTTVAGKSDQNPVVERWRQSSSPPSPGRLNALRHIILKSSNQPWRRARRYLGLLLRADFGRENIDGESLHWAHQRLLARPEARRILIVLCDGVPYDQATVEANGNSLLVDHLRAVIESIEAGPVLLLAVGTGRDVSRHYRNSVIVSRPAQIAELLFSGIARTLELES